MPESYPFGQTEYKNYDPANVNTPEDAADVFEWMAEENRTEGNGEAAAVFDECASFLRAEVLSDG